MKKLFLTLLGLLSVVASYAYDAEINGTYYNLNKNAGTATVTYGTKKYSGAFYIPTSINYDGESYFVTEIGDKAFADCTSLTSVTGGVRLEWIGDEAFMNCTGLTFYKIQGAVVVVGNQAFYGCSSLASVTIGKSVVEIGAGAFRGCGLTSVDIPNSVEIIGDEAFYECKNLESVKIGNSVKSIGKGAFDECGSLNSVYITDLAAWCNINFGDNPLFFAHDLYINGELVKKLIIPDSVEKIADGAFERCYSIESVTISNSVKEIGGGAFSQCIYLKELIIGNSVETIGDMAFNLCDDLEDVTIGKSVKFIGDYAFYYCHVKNVYISDIAAWCNNDNTWNSSPLKNGSKLYLNGELLTDLVIPNSITSIRAYAFSSCEYITSVTIPNSVTSIGEGAFAGCGITTLTLPASVTKIDHAAFDECYSLTEIYSLNPTPPSIGQYTFPFNENAKIYVPAKSVEAYRNAIFWSDYNICAALDPCDAPQIAIVSGNLSVTSSTKGAKCVTKITSDDINTFKDDEIISLSGVYNISAYAHAEGYSNSETTTATLVWVNPTLNGGETNVLSMEMKKAVLIISVGNALCISGTEEGEEISLYSIDGKLLTSVTASGSETTLGTALQKGQVYVVKIGDKSVKYRF